jgi:hypothetical protein
MSIISPTDEQRVAVIGDKSDSVSQAAPIVHL